MDQKKLTEFFSSASKPPPKKRKRSTLVAEGSSSNNIGGTSKETKRSKSDTPKTKPAVSSQKTRVKTRSAAAALPAADDGLSQSTQFRGGNHRSPSPVQKLRKALPKLQIAPGPVPIPLDDPDSPLTPLSDEYDTDPVAGSSRDASMTSVTSADVDSRKTLQKPSATIPVDFSTPRRQRIISIDSDDEDATSEPIPAPRFGFSTPRNKRVAGRNEVPQTPSVIPSSQSQYLSPWKDPSTTGWSPIKPLSQRRFVSDDDIIESSQSQERELDLDHVPEMPGSAALRFDSSTPCPPGPLQKEGSFSQELPLQEMSIQEMQPSHSESTSPVTAGNTPVEPTEKESQQRFQYLSQAASFPYDDFPQPDSFESQQPTPRRIIVQARGYDADDSATECSDESDSDMLPPSSIPRTSSGSPQKPSPAELESQDTYCSIPPELADFREMFQGDGSYPPDFPMSLRF